MIMLDCNCLSLSQCHFLAFQKRYHVDPLLKSALIEKNVRSSALKGSSNVLRVLMLSVRTPKKFYSI